MNLRIIAGTLKGRVIRCPEKSLPFRPTLSRIRTSVADLLQPRLAGATAADLCAGSGAMGFEMLSRGAERVDFVENNRATAALIRRHAEQFGVYDRCRIVEQEIEGFLRQNEEKYDITFFDPPYAEDSSSKLLPTLIGHIAPGGILLIQRAARTRRKGHWLSEEPLSAPVSPDETRTYGITEIDIYRV